MGRKENRRRQRELQIKLATAAMPVAAALIKLISQLIDLLTR